MATEEQIKALAYEIWEQEGRPDGKHVEHYYRAISLLEVKKTAPPSVIQLPGRQVPKQLSPPPQRKPEAPAAPAKKPVRRKKK
jgi:hypothetical protein